MAQNLSLLLMLIGAFFMFVAALGVVRLPDLLTRLHAGTKSATFGAGCLMLGAALHFGELAIWVRALAVVIFLFVTAPVTAHLIGRAAYLSGVPMWEGTLNDSPAVVSGDDKTELGGSQNHQESRSPSRDEADNLTYETNLRGCKICHF